MVTVVLVAVLSMRTLAQQPTNEESAELAKQLSNPVASLVSVPFQFNWEANVGPSELTRFVLNVQPVMPFAMSPEWNLIVRLITPFISQPPLVEDGTAAFGIGDITPSFFVSPAHPKRLIWGAGPVFNLPSTSEPTLGAGKWAAGPTALVLKQEGAWTVGALWNQLWSFSGDPSRSDVNRMFLQPFLAYQATHTVTFNVASEMTADWTVDNDDGRWTVPIIVAVSKLSSLGSFPASFQFGVGGYPVHPDIGPSWKVRGAIVLLLPKPKPK